MSREKGGFTLPGEAGCEDLTLKMAQKWGADVIRDSDGTKLSPAITKAGYGIYSTICIIRGHNKWAQDHMNCLQQTILMSDPKDAQGDTLTIHLLDGYFTEQFAVNTLPESVALWQVFDRTSGEEVSRDFWEFDSDAGTVTVKNTKAWHSYTVNFFAWRIWEEISMYNYTTNHWTGEHLMPVDPVYPQTRAYLLKWLDDWCRNNPDTTVVRFTSLFYNFVWIWGDQEALRNRFTDWGSYDFTVSPAMLAGFRDKYGYSLTTEDFINGGKRQVTHMPPTPHKRDYMAYVHDFVIGFGKQLVDLVHSYGKKAYLFYDDSWVGTEPYSDRFEEFGFDGIIKCVFSAFEVRLCSGVKTQTHEIRLHPYLFPVGLGGAPTFVDGGHPTLDAMQYWQHVRRGLLRAPIQRIGLGGYLHLTEKFPDFQDYIEKISDDFRDMEHLMEAGKPLTFRPRVAVLHVWGKLRSWILSGHFHETYMHDLIHVNEALAGLPFDVSFISFEDVKDGALENYDIVINCGREGDAWSGGDVWADPQLVSTLKAWTAAGGVFVGINEPSAVYGGSTLFAMSDVLGVDEDRGARVCHGSWKCEEVSSEGLIPEGARIPHRGGRYLSRPGVLVYAQTDGSPDLTFNRFGRGTGVYMSGFQYSPENIRLLENVLLEASGQREEAEKYLAGNPLCECTYFPASGKVIVVNNSDKKAQTSVFTGGTRQMVTLEPYGMTELKTVLDR